jgi:hypothetical protein
MDAFIVAHFCKNIALAPDLPSLFSGQPHYFFGLFSVIQYKKLERNCYLLKKNHIFSVNCALTRPLYIKYKTEKNRIS